MRKSLIMACSAVLITLPSLAFAQEAAGGAGVGNADSSAGASGNVHAGPNSITTPPGPGLYEGRSSTTAPLPPQNKVGDMPSSRESIKGNNAAGAHDSE